MRANKGAAFLTVPSIIFKTAVQIRHGLYDKGILFQHKLSLPVVSIGNLVVGGTGKTQIALLLAKELLLSMKVALLCRGYRARRGKSFPLFIDGQSYEECGDEPWLLASRLPGAFVASGKDRIASAHEAERRGADVLVLDDGMQHRRLRRDLEIVAIDGSDPFGGGHFLPRGMLREDPKRLSQADLVVIVGEMALRDKAKLAELSSAPCVEVKIVPQPIRELVSDLPLTPLQRGTPVGVFCGIGNPERFFKQVEAMGLTVVATHALPDHKKIGKKEMEAFAVLSKQKGAECLLCTEKDKVKLSEADVPKALPVGWIPVDLEIVDGQTAWDKMLQKIKQLAGIPL